MSRAFVNEDARGPEPRYHLPARDDPGYDSAAAWALIEGANVGDSLSAEAATGYRWGSRSSSRTWSGFWPTRGVSRTSGSRSWPSGFSGHTDRAASPATREPRRQAGEQWQ